MRSLTKVGPRSAALSRQYWGRQASNIRHSGALICTDVPSTASAADGTGNRARHMSVNTRGASPRSGEKPAAEEVEENRVRRAREYIQSASKSSSTSTGGENVSASVSDAQRETFEEKQPDTDVDFQAVREAPPASNQQWWYPDPVTGYFVPQSSFGEISTSNVAVSSEGKKPLPTETTSQVQQKAAKKAPAPTPAFKKLSGVPSKGEKGGWWTSMEELPDYDHLHMRS